MRAGRLGSERSDAKAGWEVPPPGAPRSPQGCGRQSGPSDRPASQHQALPGRGVGAETLARRNEDQSPGVIVVLKGNVAEGTGWEQGNGCFSLGPGQESSWLDAAAIEHGSSSPGRAASQARGWLGGGFHLPGEGKKGKRLHVNAGKYSYFSFSFVLKRPWC